MDVATIRKMLIVCAMGLICLWGTNAAGQTPQQAAAA